MSDTSQPPPDDPGPAPPAVTPARFTFDESKADLAPTPGRWLRTWWWSGTRIERWAAAVGAPVSLLLLLATCNVLNSDDLARPTTAASGSTTARPTAEPTSASPTPTPTPTQGATVTTIMSGDTVVVLRDGNLETVRLIGIDAPEVVGSAAGVQCWAVESLQFASATLLQREVRLVADPTQGDVDSAGATLAYVLLNDGRDFSVISASGGHARTDPASAPASKTAEIAAAEQAGRTSGLGLWGPPCNGGVVLPPPVDLPIPSTTTAPAPLPGVAPRPPPGHPTPPPAPPPAPRPPPGDGLDPRFHNCQQANRDGYGPYRRGVHAEYWWYKDQDGDGVVCD